MNGGLVKCLVSRARDTPAQSTKRRYDATSNPPPAKRAQLTRSGAQRPQIEDANVEQTTLHHPQPKPRSASFLKDYVSPNGPGSRDESVYTFVSEWLETIGADREKCCRSESHLQHCSGHSPISRDLAKSAPEMSDGRDSDVFKVPSKPASSTSIGLSPSASPMLGSTAGSTASSKKSLVEQPRYVKFNLRRNNIYLRAPSDDLPKDIKDLIAHVRRDRDSQGPSPEQLKSDAALFELENGAAETKVEQYFNGRIFPMPEMPDSLERTMKIPMDTRTVPQSRPDYKISIPQPDMLYGYNLDGAFPQYAETEQLEGEFMANSQDLLLPFLAIEFKGEGGSMWTATKQCIGASVCCVNIAERFNDKLRNHQLRDKTELLNSAAFSIALNGTESRLFISWKDNENKYRMQKFDCFLLQKPEQYLEFRKCVLNIIEWGRDTRVKKIQSLLDSLEDTEGS